MLLAMAFTTLSMIGSLLLLQSAKDVTEAASYVAGGVPAQCSNDVIANIWATLPKCIPRDTIVELPLPNDPDVVEVIPSHVLVPKCSGVCHQGNTFHQCVPADGARVTKAFKVMLRKLGSDQNTQMECTTVNVETHSKCKCGCDVESASCTPKQEYDHHFCKCRCRNTDDRAKCHQDKRRKYWDETNCQCVCRMEEYKECSTGFIFDAIETCACVRESAMNLAGVEVVVTLVVVIVLLAVAVAVLSWKLSKSYRVSRQAANQQGQELTKAPSCGLTWPELGEDEHLKPV